MSQQSINIRTLHGYDVYYGIKILEDTEDSEDSELDYGVEETETKKDDYNIKIQELEKQLEEMKKKYKRVKSKLKKTKNKDEE
jgi:molecular chaperone GrpE (heat shock protein)